MQRGKLCPFPLRRIQKFSLLAIYVERAPKQCGAATGNTVAGKVKSKDFVNKPLASHEAETTDA